MRAFSNFLASTIAIFAIVSLPASAQAVTANLTTVAVMVNDGPPTVMAQNDVVDVVTHGPIAQSGRAEHILYTSWSTQSLQLQGSGAYDSVSNPNGLTYPEGWTLEYSTDGESWSTSAPGDLATIIAVRARGDIKSKGRGIFETTTVAEPVASSEGFGGGAAGDGYNVGFGNGILLNSWHHNNDFHVECHYFDGAECEDYVYTVTGYQTSMASSIYVDKDTDKAYSYVRQNSSGDIGVICVDYSDIANGNVANCPTLFTSLADVASGGLTYEYRGASSAQDGDKLWSLDVSTGNLLCFDISIPGACTGGLNGANVGSAGATTDGITKARVTAVEGKVFFTVNDTFGCFDPATTSLCGDPDSTPVSIPAAVYNVTYNRHPPVPVHNSDGSFRGVCDINSQTCLDDDGATVTIPAGLSAYWTANPPNNDIGGRNAQQWAVSENKMYYPGPGDPSNPYSEAAFKWSSTLVCWDYSTDALCSGFEGTEGGIYLPYSASIDPDNPGCVWLNQDKGWLPGYVGKIIPFDADTGEVGCASGEAIVELPYAGVVPRMGCDDDGRVISWQDIQLNLNGLSPNDITISIRDDSGAEVAGWQEIAVDSNGFLDMSELTVAESSTTPTIQLVGQNGATLAELETVTGTVTFEAEDPEMCFSLRAETNCPDELINNPAVPDVPPGIVEGSSITYPANGGREVGSKQRTTIPGTNSGALCAATAWSAYVPTLADTGFDSAAVAFGGFAVLSAGIGALVYTKRRRANV